jgi:BirA family biotin operon repressor/biotin-[acetyl-CoA-carboxylase] ligase
MVSEDYSTWPITRGLQTSVIGQKVIYYPRLPSTMDVTREKARGGAAEGTVVITGEQTEGRGRQRRTWLTPAGNIALSILLYPDIAVLPYLVMIASLAVTHSIESVTGLKTQIKWPNDILIGGKKVSGILIESKVRGNKVEYAIVGIGINVDLKTADVAEISTTATSLKEELDTSILRASLVRNLLTEFERWYLRLPEGESIYAAWREQLVTLGKRVVVNSGGDVLKGVAESVDETGALVLRLEDGSLNTVVAGDVTLKHG